MEKNFFVYIVASGHYGTLYVGMTSDLSGRVSKHRQGTYDGFTRKYNVRNLVWYEPCGSAEHAIRREKRLKKYNRDWKINLIERENPHWEDLFESICQ